MAAPPPLADPFFLSAVDHSGDSVCVLDLEGRVLFINAGGLQVIAAGSGRDYIGSAWLDLWPDEVKAEAAAAIKAALGGKHMSFRAFSRSPDAAVTCWDAAVSPVLDPKSGEVINLLTSSRDVTVEVNQAALLRAVIDNVPAAITVKSADDGRIRLVNAGMETLVGRSAESMVGRTDRELFPPAEAAFFEAKDRELLASDSAILIEQEPITAADGRKRVLRTKKMAISEGGRPRYVVCVSEDITEDLEAAEELRQALASAEAASLAKSEFLANMSHEIRTPLNGVMGVAGALSRTTLSPGQTEMVSIIETSAKTLETLLSDILDLSRIEAGKIELRPEPFDLAASVNACTTLFEASARAKGLDLQVSIQEDALGGYVGDAPRIRQILSNLVSNAVKFTGGGEVRVQVSADRGETSSRLRFDVSDTGIGFDAETKARLFSRFEQADGSITRRFGGTGLGLSISRALAEAMGGALDATATPGRGACFTLLVELPRCTGGFDLWVEDEVQNEADVAKHRGLRVLVAEDHPVNRRVVELILGGISLAPMCVENGAEAVEAVETQDFDLVLMDMQMPVMDGLTAIRAIRAREAELGRPPLPIHVLTANAMPEHVAASRQAGADGHLAKPILAEHLLALIDEVSAARSTSSGCAAASVAA